MTRCLFAALLAYVIAAGASVRSYPLAMGEEGGGEGRVQQSPGGVQSTTVSTPLTSPRAQQALLNQYCITCHNSKAKTGGLSLDALSLERIDADGETWEKVVRKLRAGLMPPAGMPRPARATLDAFAGALETAI